MAKTRVKMLLIMLLLAVPGAVKAQDQSSPTYTKSEIDAKLNELRALLAQTATRSDLDARFTALRSALDHDASEADQHLEATRQSLDTFRSNISQTVDSNEKTDQQRALKMMDDVAAFEHSDELYNYIGPTVAALIGAVALVLVSYYAHRRQDFEKKIADRRQALEDQIEKDRKDAERKKNQIESTLEFSRRFGELLQLQSKLNLVYERARATDETRDMPATELETNEARTWWWLFFDLLLYEYDFFKQDLVWSERFAEWIRWRWYDFKASGDDVWQTCGMDYKKGWNNWKGKPANRKNRLVQFLDKVHEAPDIATVERIVADEPLVPHEDYRLGERDEPTALAAAS